MEPSQSAEDVGRHVLVPAGLGGSMMRLGDPEIRYALEEPLQAHPALGAGQGRARAHVVTVAEGDVAAGVAA